MNKAIYIFLLLISFSLKGQMFDSISASLTHKPQVYANYDTRNSFITNQIAKIQSVKLGLTWNKQFTLAIGYNWLNTNFQTTLQDGIQAELKTRFITPFVEYSFLEHKNIEVTIPVHLGFGTSFYQDCNNAIYKRNFIMMYEPSMTATLRFLKYFGVGAGIGYRLMLVGNREIQEEFNSPIYVVKTKIFFSDIYNDIFKKK